MVFNGTAVYAVNESSASSGDTTTEVSESSESTENTEVSEPEVVSAEEQKKLSTEGSYEISADRDPETNEVDTQVDDASADAKRIAPRTAATSKTFLVTEESVEDVIRSYLKARKATFTVAYKTEEKKGDVKKYLNNLSNRLIFDSCNHTGVADEGDYLLYHLDGFEAVATLKQDDEGYWFIEIKYNVSYFSTAEQEKVVKTKVKELLKTLKIDEKESDYAKIRAIYDYMCENIKYDDKHVNNEKYLLKYTAYAALVNKKAVCQGYSNLFYRLALAAGVDARLIAGTAHGESHSWDIVKINSVYYNLDATWDADSYPKYHYFLLNTKNFKNHKRTSDYSNSSFTAKYTMSKLNYTEQTENPIESLSLSQTYIPLGVGEKALLVASAVPVDTANLDHLQWISNDTSVATVKDGTVKAVGMGTTKIIVYVGNVYAECKVTVTAMDAEKNAEVKPATLTSKYSGKNIRPDVTITVKGKTLKKKKDYIVTYPAQSKEIGTYTMKITFKGNYTGVIKKTYTIIPKGVTVSSLKSTEKATATLKWQKVINSSGYQIEYSDDASFDDATQISIDKSKLSKKLTDLSSKKKYYIRIRSYKTVAHKKYYSKWAKVRTIKVK